MQPYKVVEGINNRDRKTQTWVYEYFFTRILNTVKRITKDSPDSGDITRDVFAVLFKHSKPFETVRNIYQFAYRTATNKSIDHKNDHVDDKNHEADIIHHFRTIERKNRENAESDDRFTHLIYLAEQTLPRQCKLVFLLHYLCHLKNAQIAEKLGITKRTVETHMTNAYRVLRIEIKKDGNRYIFSIMLIL
jgi:RNA polymerase sigma-70 factor (ECF subfamily)